MSITKCEHIERSDFPKKEGNYRQYELAAAECFRPPNVNNCSEKQDRKNLSCGFEEGILRRSRICTVPIPIWPASCS
jgi:hypothetical protein